MRRWAGGCIFGLLAASIALADTPSRFVPFAIRPGADPQRVEHALRSAGATSVTRVQRHEPGALCRGLVDSGLLETLNHFGAAPLDGQSRLDPQAFQTVLTARIDGRRHTLAFRDAATKSSRPRLEAALVRIPVPVDPEQDPPGGWSPKRLHRLRQALAGLAPCRLKPLDTDRHGNTFAWRGAHPSGWKVYAWYLPERDELRVLSTVPTSDRTTK